MPGRPRTTLKVLTELLQRAETYGSELYNQMPRQYRDRPDANDPICQAWLRAGQAAIQNYLALEALRDHVAEKVARAEQRKAGAEMAPR
jgi:hypothetical protein